MRLVKQGGNFILYKIFDIIYIERKNKMKFDDRYSFWEKTYCVDEVYKNYNKSRKALREKYSTDIDAAAYEEVIKEQAAAALNKAIENYFK